MKTLTRRLQAALKVLFPSAPDDLMVIAEATGVAATTPAPAQLDAEYVEMVIDWHAHPAHREEFTDPALEQMLLAWSQAAAGGDDK